MCWLDHTGARHLGKEETAPQRSCHARSYHQTARASPTPTGRGRLLASPGLWDQLLSTA